MTKEIAYQYKNMPIPGGGYVTGLYFHPEEKDLLYIRTDIGGTYRFDSTTQRFKSLISHVTMEDISETYPISIALDPKYPKRLYIACGIYMQPEGTLAISEDYGETFSYEKIPAMIHGNLNGRGTAERLLVDSKNSDTLYFASQQEGLFVTYNRGKNWEKLTALPEDYLTFVCEAGKALVVGTAGVTTKKSEQMRGHSLYISYDKGQSFVPLLEPENHVIEGCKMNGLVAQRYAVDEKYFYVTFASTGRRSYVIENGYSCDSGDTIDGHIVRYVIDKDGSIGDFTDITPGKNKAVSDSSIADVKPFEPLDFGFSGISVSMQRSGVVIASTIVKDDADSIYLSMDHGETWKEILYDLERGDFQFRAAYMRPEYNGKHSIVHWMSDLKINPFDEQEAWFNSGTGVFRIRGLLTEHPVFMDWSDGIEETVHLNVYSVPKGEVKALAILGDLGGFAFTNLDTPCDNSFADADGNRYITCINADFSDEFPENIVVTPRGNWKGKTKGGLILTKDQCKTFRRLPMPFGLSRELDDALHLIENPNVNSGWVAMSPDCQNLVWSVANQIDLPMSRVIVSQNGGETFEKVQVYDLYGNKKEAGKMKVFSDRCDSQLFFGFGEASQIYVSQDGGKSFYQKMICDENGSSVDFPEIDFGKIDVANKTEVRGETGKTGVFYLALGEAGLWKLRYDKKSEKEFIKLEKLSKKYDIIYRVGLGILRPEGDYYKEDKAIYLNGIIDGVYGFYRSFDDGKTFERINTKNQMYGEINSIDGDCRVFGRFYLATGSNGVLYGDQCE